MSGGGAGRGPRPAVLAVTTSMHTRWEDYSQALLRRNAPRWRRIVVDGRRNWRPLGFVEKILDCDAEYVVHVDEDCFVFDGEGVEGVVEEMRRRPGCVAAGVPDGGHYYRELNPAALNLFFVVFEMRALRAAWAERDRWPGLAFSEGWKRDALEQQPALDADRVAWDGAEPYYPLFWQLLSAGGRFLYLGNRLRADRWSTLVLDHRGSVIAEHLWYLRRWFSAEAMPGHDCPNRRRFESLRAEVDRRHRGDWRFALALLRSRVARVAGRIRPANG